VSGLFYYLMTFAESLTSVFGYRGAYEQPRYVIIQPIGENAEIRLYEPRTAIEARVDIQGDRDKAASEAFGALFRYIAGANQRDEKIAMTAPVRTDTTSHRIAMTAPVQTTTQSGTLTMRFFLPRDVAANGAPVPTDQRLHLMDVPQTTLAVLRYAGVDSVAANTAKAAELMKLLAATDWQPKGEPFKLNYDPPFTIPAFRRNEAAIEVSRRAQ
jgi:hypothetical protein